MSFLICWQSTVQKSGYFKKNPNFITFFLDQYHQATVVEQAAPSVTPSHHRVSLLLKCANKSCVEQKQKWAIQIHSFKHMTLFSFPIQKHLHIEHIAFGYLHESLERVISRSPSAWHTCQTAEFEDSRRQTGWCKKKMVIKIKSSFFDICCEMLMTEIKVTMQHLVFLYFPPYYWLILLFPWKKNGLKYQ